MHTKSLGCLVLLVLLQFVPTHGFLFDSQPKTYAEQDPIPLKVNKITSIRTNIPYPYYTLPFCTPADTHYSQGNLAQILRGDHIEDSLYEINALETIDCRVINYLPNTSNNATCTEYTEEGLKKFKDKIALEYTIHWSLDDLPAAVPKLYVNSATKIIIQKQYTVGFPLGLHEYNSTHEDFLINNHVDINIIYRNATDNPERIVILAFEVAPRSQWYDPENWADLPDDEDPKKMISCPHESLRPYERQSLLLAQDETGKSIFWTYSVHWEPNAEINWSTRWNVYLRDAGGSIHLVSVLNALIIVLFLLVVFMTIIKRTLYPDASYDEEETRWRLVAMEAFRAPAYPLALSVLIGSGAQVIGMTVVTMVFGVFGMLSPIEQGAFTMPLIGFFVTMGLFSGFFSMHCYKIFRGTHRLKNILATAFTFPIFVFFFCFIINLSEREANSSATVPFTTFAYFMLLWFGISVPLVFIGGLFGYLKPLSEARIHNNQTLRTIHKKRVWYQRPFFSILFAGVLPFGVVVIEYFFILFSLWGLPIYNSYRYLIISLVTLFITCGCTNVLVVFFQLNSGNYFWWWRPWLHSAASALYLFLYSTFVFFSNFKLQHSWDVTIILYFSFATIASSIFFLLTGTVSFAACYFFVQAIYKHTNTHP